MARMIKSVPIWNKVIALLMAIIFATGTVRTAYAQTVSMPAPGTMVSLSASITPPLLKGVKFYADNPFQLDFIIDRGDSTDPADQLKSESTRMIKYFLASMTVPEKDLWVNLSPYEKDRIVPDAFGITEMGRDLLAQDYILKQITASVIYPEGAAGKAFWAKVYAEAQKRYGTSDVPVDTFNKVWIVPEKALVYESRNSAYLIESKLKVMLDEDYLALEKNTTPQDKTTPATNKLGSDIVREVVIPILEKEVNEGKNFVILRQVYNSLILAVWYKDKVKESLLGSAYIDKNKTGGVDIEDKAAKEKIWDQYVEAFKTGVYNYIKQDIDPATQQPIPRKYFSGGVGANMIRKVYRHEPIEHADASQLAILSDDSFNQNLINVRLDPAIDGYTRFQDWLTRVSPERLHNKVFILNVLETLVHGLSDRVWDVSKANAETLNSLIFSGLVNKEDISEMRSNGMNILEILVQGLGDQDGDLIKAHTDTLNCLIKAGFVSKEDIYEKRSNGMTILETLGQNVGNTIWDVSNVNAETLNSLIAAGIVSKDDVKEVLNDKIIIENRLQSFGDRDSEASKVTANTLRILITAGLVSKEAIKEAIKEKNILKSLLNGLSDPGWNVSKTIADTLSSLITNALVSKEDLIEAIKDKNIAEIFVHNLDAPAWYVRKANADTLNILISAGILSKNDIDNKLSNGTTIPETLLKGFGDQDRDVLKAYADALNRLIIVGLVNKEDINKKRSNGTSILETLLHGLNDPSWNVIKANLDTLKNLITAGIMSKNDVNEKRSNGKIILEAIIHGLDDQILNVSNADADTLNSLIDVGIVSNEDVKRAIKDKHIVETLVHGIGNPAWNVSKANVNTLKSLITAGLLSKEDVKLAMKEKKGLETIIQGLSFTQSNVSMANEEALFSLITSGLLSKEDVYEKRSNGTNLLETLIQGLGDPAWHVRIANTDTLYNLTTAGFVSRETVKEAINKKNILEILVRDLDYPSWNVKKSSTDTLNHLITAGLIDKEEGFKRAEISKTFRDFHGKEFPASGFLHNYLKILLLFKNDPRIAYEMSFWNDEELDKLFQVFGSFINGVAMDEGLSTESDSERILKNRLVADCLDHIKNPKLFLLSLNEKFRTIINDGSIKLAIRVHEVASVNAAKGLLQALGFKKNNVILLYDKEIDFHQAKTFFPGYLIKAYQGFKGRNVVKVEFHDYGNMTMESIGGTLESSLPYTPFKFNLPTWASEEAGEMKRSLGIDTQRKVIVIGSPSDTEFGEFIQAYNTIYGRLAYPKRPLLVIGFRQRRNENELRLLGALSGQSIAVRSDAGAPLPDVRTNNVLILNTIGELLKMYALANIAIVGNDRNIFEPASQQTAVLFFDGSWQNNWDAKDALVKTGAARIFSKENLERLLNSSEETAEMGEKGTDAVETYRRDVHSKAEEFMLQVIGAMPQLRNKVIASSQISPNNADPAQLNRSDYGGIDLTPGRIDLQITDSGSRVKFDIDPVELQRLQNAGGLTPVIINIQPMPTSVLMFLGVNDETPVTAAAL